MTDIDKTLSLQEGSLARDNEIERILGCEKGDHFAILDIDPRIDPTERASVIKKIYRKKSLLIHPDKTDNKDAPEAFDRLKKAESVLSTEEDNDNAMWHDKTRLLDIYEDVSKRETELNQIRTAVAAILREELRQQEIDRLYQQRQQVQKQEEEKREQLRLQREARAKHVWEDERDVRVKTWREYNHKVEKKRKKKKKPSVLA